MCQDMMRAEIWLQETLASQLGIEELASRMGYSSSQVRRRFRNYFGISPGAYRDRLRLEKAARLLVHTPRDVNHIARTCGYRNHSAFTRAFQRRYGHPPRRYRQRLRLNLKQRQPGSTFAYDIVELPRRKAVLTRLYRPPHVLTDLHDWQGLAEGAEALPSALDNAPALAILQDQPLEGALPRLDLGVQIDIATTHLALPPTFRIQELPAQRHACIGLERPEEVQAAMLYMACRGVSGGESLSGEAPHLLLQRGELKLRIPLL